MVGTSKVAAFASGTVVEAKVQGWKAYYKGKIVSFDDAEGTYGILFEDGESKTGVKGFQIRAVKSNQVALTAPDGKTFESKLEYRKYMTETFYSFADAEGKTLVRKQGDVSGQGFTVKNLKKCNAAVMDHSDQVLVDGIEDCTLLIGPSCESVFVRNAKNCHLFIACKQFRCRDCSNCKISLYTKTEPVVETSTGMRFYPYNASYPNQAAHFVKANLAPTHNHWCNVFDFNKGDSSIPEPHWEVIPEEEGWPAWQSPEPLENAENPVPSTARATVVPKESGFAIGISQEQAAQAFKAQEQQQQLATVPVPAPAAPCAPPSIPEEADVSPVLAEQGSEVRERASASEEGTRIPANPPPPLEQEALASALDKLHV